MYLDNILGGRREKRLPIMIAVRLTTLESVSAERQERTYTDNISSHGARVISTRPWQRGEQTEITTMNQEPPMRGEVIYCQKVENDRFIVGVKFLHSRIPWSILQRYNGL